VKREEGEEDKGDGITVELRGCACRRKKEEQGNKIRVIETFHFVQLRGK